MIGSWAVRSALRGNNWDRVTLLSPQELAMDRNNVFAKSSVPGITLTCFLLLTLRLSTEYTRGACIRVYSRPDGPTRERDGSRSSPASFGIWTGPGPEFSRILALSHSFPVIRVIACSAAAYIYGYFHIERGNNSALTLRALFK